jgi:hypothetical protein
MTRYAKRSLQTSATKTKRSQPCVDMPEHILLPLFRRSLPPRAVKLEQKAEQKSVHGRSLQSDG